MDFLPRASGNKNLDVIVSDDHVEAGGEAVRFISDYRNDYKQLHRSACFFASWVSSFMLNRHATAFRSFP